MSGQFRAGSLKGQALILKCGQVRIFGLLKEGLSAPGLGFRV